MKTRTVSKSATANRPAARTVNRNVRFETSKGEHLFNVNVPATTWDKFCELVPDPIARGEALAPIMKRMISELGGGKIAGKLIPVTVTFTQAQLDRLTAAAKIVGCTVDELIVSGAMHGIDCEGDTLEDAIESTLSGVDWYARQRRTVPEGERHDHPMGSMTKAQLQEASRRWAREHPSRTAAPVEAIR